ncbi:MAG TPA: hypothetical protein VG167_22325 [Verrucomicrobiae bacterium]|nr:hypothetical protein [Verrucomicrobiae bacterium]
MSATPAIQPEAGSIAGASSRLEFIDNLRWMMIVLVVSMHAAVTYSHLGSWYFMEDPVPARGVLVLFAAYQMFLQAFFMGLLFLIAVFHPPLLIAVTLALRGFDAPKIVKFLGASVLGVVVAYLASSLVFRRTPLLKRVL